MRYVADIGARKTIQEVVSIEFVTRTEILKGIHKDIEFCPAVAVKIRGTTDIDLQ